jgi:hypothetical protein
MRYDRLISLGTYCETAAQIHRYTGVESAYLFDWIETHWDGLIHCFETGFANFFELENLRPLSNNKGVMDLATKFLTVHHFGVKGDRTIRPGTIERDYKRVKATLRFLIAKFNEMLDEEYVLLIRVGHTSEEKLWRLWRAMERAHPNGRFDLLILNRDERQKPIDHPRIKFDIVSAAPPGPDFWLGDNQSWDRVLAHHAPENRRLVAEPSRVDTGKAWVARYGTCLKKHPRYASTLSGEEKMHVSGGAVLKAQSIAAEAAHYRLIGATLDGHSIEDGWFAYPGHWAPVSVGHE